MAAKWLCGNAFRVRHGQKVKTLIPWKEKSDASSSDHNLGSDEDYIVNELEFDEFLDVEAELSSILTFRRRQTSGESKLIFYLSQWREQ